MSAAATPQPSGSGSCLIRTRISIFWNSVDIEDYVDKKAFPTSKSQVGILGVLGVNIYYMQTKVWRNSLGAIQVFFLEI